MDKTLVSIGLDVGTTSTQFIVSRLAISNHASSFAVPEMEIESRTILYRSPIHFTPLLEGNLVDGEKIRALMEEEYKNAGISPDDVDTGAVIITGETSRRENAKAVLDALSAEAGKFVVATAGPALESVLAAHGAGAVAYAAQTGKTVFHIDIGGGTSNLALIENGQIICTDCLNVGGRLIKVTEQGTILYVSPVLHGLCPFSVGDTVTPADLQPVAELLTEALEMAVGLREETPLLARLRTEELGMHPRCKATCPILSFSGGVADCIETSHAPFRFGDMGPILGKAIRNSRLCQGAYRLGEETIRATVIGAGCHSTQLSGSTVFFQNITFPLKNRPVVTLTNQDLQLPASALHECIRGKLATQDTISVLSFSGPESLNYETIKALAHSIGNAMKNPILIAIEKDMAKALGQAIALYMPPETEILCIDNVRLRTGDYLDIGNPIGPALPVVVKTLILEHERISLSSL